MEGVLSMTHQQSMVSWFLEIAICQTLDTVRQFFQETRLLDKSNGKLSSYEFNAAVFMIKMEFVSEYLYDMKCVFNLSVLHDHSDFEADISYVSSFEQLGAAAICQDNLVPSVDDLAYQILDVLNYFGLGAVMCMGVTAGAYILSLFVIKNRERVLDLILVSPLCKAPSWTE